MTVEVAPTTCEVSVCEHVNTFGGIEIINHSMIFRPPEIMTNSLDSFFMASFRIGGESSTLMNSERHIRSRCRRQVRKHSYDTAVVPFLYFLFAFVVLMENCVRWSVMHFDIIVKSKSIQHTLNKMRLRHFKSVMIDSFELHNKERFKITFVGKFKFIFQTFD